ncbi:MAG: hypothetical protein ACW981_01735 [Candidatus Hodarchaeales archaeon]|jgi:hypothetical protein
MTKADRSQQYKSFIILADIPIFVIVGTIVGYYLFGGNNSDSSSVGALGGAIIFFIFSLIPVIRLAYKEHYTDMLSISKNQQKVIENKETVKNTLFSSQNQRED